MAELEQEVRRRYLDKLDDLSWDEEDPRLDFGSKALHIFVAAFMNSSSPEHRSRLIRVIWQFRSEGALTALAVALDDPSDAVWKESLDGLVTIGGNQALVILKNARATMAVTSASSEKFQWIDEAITQIKEGSYGPPPRKNIDSPPK